MALSGGYWTVDSRFDCAVAGLRRPVCLLYRWHGLQRHCGFCLAGQGDGTGQGEADLDHQASENNPDSREGYLLKEERIPHSVMCHVMLDKKERNKYLLSLFLVNDKPASYVLCTE